MAAWNERRNRTKRSYRSSSPQRPSRWQASRQQRGAGGGSALWLVMLLLLFLVGGLRQMPYAWAEQACAYLSYCFVPGAAAETELASWLDLQPSIPTWRRGGEPDAEDGLVTPVIGPVAAQFGWAYHPITGEFGLQTGVFIQCEGETPIKAIRTGVVEQVTFDTAQQPMVVIDHGGGLKARYGNLSEVSVQVGDRVKQKQIIGKAAVGRTGGASYLFFEIIENGTPVNPLSKFSEKIGP